MPHETIGERLRRLRLERELTQGQLAAGITSAAYVSRVENGERRAAVPILRHLAERLSVSSDYLETGQEDPKLLRAHRRIATLETEIAELRLPANADEETAGD